jgi:threonine dehydrogenase-like Zn-dependent dehydrogenase
MKKYYVVGRRQLVLRHEPLVEPGAGEVLIRTRVSALSVGTEVWRYSNGGHYGGEGSTCGYNSAGVIEAVGAGVTGLQPGDAVFAAEPHAEFMLADARRVIRLAAGVDFEAGAFTYLPTLGLHALRSADYAVGDNVLVIGQGIVGVLAAQVAQLAGARVAAIEVDTQRRSVAEQAGIRTVVDPREAGALERVEAFFGAPGPDVIVETSQNWSGLMDAMRLAHTGSRIAVLSIYRTPPPDELAQEVLRSTFMDRDRFHNQRVRFIACSNDLADDYPPDVARWTISRNMHYIAEQIAAGALAPTRAITHRFRWDELEQVYERLLSGDRGMVGVTLHWD